MTMTESAFSSLRHSEDEVESVSPYVMIALGPTSALQMKLMKVFHGKIPNFVIKLTLQKYQVKMPPNSMEPICQYNMS